MTHISNDKLPLLAAKLFSRSAFNDIVFLKNNRLIDALVENTGLSKNKNYSLSDLFDIFYKILLKSYRNEYVFKNSLAVELIKKRHRFSNVSYINELRANNSICDIAIFNGTSTAYEIKTKLDSFDRLPAQLMDYQTIFDKVYVVCDASRISNLERSIASNIGIYELTSKNKVTIVKEALSNMEYLSNKSIFYCLRPSEIEKIFKEKLNYILPKKAKEKRIESLIVFEALDTSLVHQYFVEIMRDRCLEVYEKEVFKKLPYSILAMLLNLRLNKKKLIDLNDRMCQHYTIS